MGKQLYLLPDMGVKIITDVGQMKRAQPTGWTRQRLDSSVALPQPVVNQLACCLYGAGYAEDFNQAKAMAAVETGSLAA